MTGSGFNFNLCGYRTIAEIYSSSKTVVYRAERIDDEWDAADRAVIIKVLSSVHPTERDLLEFRHQYQIAKNLNIPGVVRPYSLEPYGRGYAIVMEDYGGISLDLYRQQYQLSLKDILQIAIEFADILHALGRQRIVHKDIKPANIAIHPVTKQVKLTDFGIGSRLPQENLKILSPSLLEGTLAYLSPEQTGRMNRGIDLRSDFYAFGVTLYELLTGKLPFESNDPIDLIHCHLAQIAVPPHQLNSEIPEIVSGIVAKLMAKNAEDRYQSALGLKYDLALCLSQWETTGTVAKFRLAQRDLSDRFVISERLYGRESAVTALLAAFTRVSTGHTEMMLVSGASGIGKTAVIEAVHKPIARQHGYFIHGKFDQFNRNIPLSAFARAFRDLIGQLASESDARLTNWNSRILAAIGENGRVLIEVIPELERIIGAQPPVAELTGTAAQNRFQWLFQKFIEVFTQPEHPLTIFLDDLQWADAASLELIKLLMADTGYLLLVGAYRDNEVSPAHPLMLMVAELQADQKIVESIFLLPLNFLNINRLVADTLHCSTQNAQPLAALIELKTQGNPFFITQFLKALYQDGEIWFNANGYWECDIIRVQALAMTDDVVELMVAQLHKLPLATQHLLELAACIGNRFDLETLAIVSEQSQASVAAALWPGLETGSILPTSQIYKFLQLEATTQPIESLAPTLPATYRFLHDRVQQAAYTLIPERLRQSTHWKIGRLLLAKASAAEREEQIFTIVNQLNIGWKCITKPAERKQLLKLNALAARKAKLATAYAAATGYWEICMELLPAAAWQSETELVSQIYESAIEVAYLGRDYERMEGLVAIFLANTHSLIAQIRVYEIQIQSLKARGQSQAALDLGLQLLQSLGTEFPAQPAPAEIGQALAHSLLAWKNREIASFVDLPMMTDPIDLAKMRILAQMSAPAYEIAPRLLPLLIFTQIELCLAKGNCETSPFVYADYGFVLCGMVGDLEAGYQFGQLALALLDDRPDRCQPEYRSQVATCRACVFVYSFTNHWQEAIGSQLPHLQAGYQVSLATGDIESSALNAQFYCAYAYFAGQELSALAAEMEIYRQSMLQLKLQAAIFSQAIYYQTVSNLLGQADDPCCLEGNIFAETQLLPTLRSANDRIALCSFHYNKMVLSYLLGEYQQAASQAELVESYVDSTIGAFVVTLYCFYSSLVALKLYPELNELDREQCLHKIADNRSKLQKWAKFAPMNHLHKLQLVEAELHRVLGHPATALDSYELSISGAKTHGYIQEQALANELAALFYLDWGKAKVAAEYMQEAYYCYARWGAKAKTDDLERRYPQLLKPIFQPDINPFSALETINHFRSSNSDPVGNTLDLVSVIHSAQALSSTIELPELIPKLLEIILKNSGAQICLLALPVGNDLWQISSISMLTDVPIVTTQPQQSLEDSIEYPASLIYWIERTQATISGDARQALVSPEFGTSSIDDRYLRIHQPPSVLALPISKQERVLGVLYLEHRHAPDIFTAHKKIAIAFLCTQTAIALDNAHLYQLAQESAATANRQQLELLAANQQLAATNQELYRATRLKDEFVATMSHELRTPLNAILGMSEALHEQIYGSLNPRQLSSIATIERSGRHLLALINDILDVSKIAAGKLELTVSPISLSYLCESSLTFVQQQAFQKQIQLDLQLPPVPGNILVDERRIRQVAIELLGNAIKFTPPGGRVVLRASRPEQQTSIDERWLEFAVSDTGIGIAIADRHRLFQPFVQLDSSLSRQYEGTGLGLTLVKQIVELHGGNMTIESEVNRGSCFTVRLPADRALPLERQSLALLDSISDNLQPIALESIGSATILLAEDNQANINTISGYLKAKGYRMLLAENGREAIDLLRECTNELSKTQPPDVILMDIQMPEIDGLAAIGWIRQQPQLMQIPIIALTALAMVSDREKCLAAGANEYLSKPVKLQHLVATIQKSIVNSSKG